MAETAVAAKYLLQNSHFINLQIFTGKAFNVIIIVTMLFWAKIYNKLNYIFSIK